MQARALHSVDFALSKLSTYGSVRSMAKTPSEGGPIFFLHFFPGRSFRLNRADSHLLKEACIVLDTLLAHSQMLAPSSLRVTLDRCHHSLHLTDKQNEIRAGEVTCSGRGNNSHFLRLS